MFTTASLLSFLFLAVSFESSVSAKPVIAREAARPSLAFVANINVTGFQNIVAADQARAASLRKKGNARVQAKALGKRDAVSFGITNTGVTYSADVGIGSPATQYTLLIDTGSSNTWVGAGRSYEITSTSRNTGQSVSVSYGSGSFDGTEYIDEVTLAPGLVIPSQSIGVASSSQGLEGFDGILGIGPVDLTEGTVSGQTGSIPTVTDNLSAAGTIPSNSVGISFAPASGEPQVNGELTFGGADRSKYTGELSFVPITEISPANEFWGVDQSVTYGGALILDLTAGIVDTGTTLILLATNAFNAYQRAIGAQLDNTTGLLRITTAQYNNLRPLQFNIGGGTYTLSPNAQIWPRALNGHIGGEANSVYLVVSDLGSYSGGGLDFINGYTFLERFYTVYDMDTHSVGFATTEFTDAITN